MKRVMTTYGLYQALVDEGYVLPEECGDVEMRLPVDGVIQLALIVNLTDETLAMFGRALIRMAGKNELINIPKPGSKMGEVG